jgi:Mg2+/Co2+ transporter CorC
MQPLTVKDLMVPKNQYATVTAHTTLGEAALVLQEAQKLEQELAPGRHRDRAVLVVDEYQNVIGKLSMLSVLRGLLPRYDRFRGSRMSSMGATRMGSVRTMLDDQERAAALWSKPLDNLIEKASSIKVDQLIRPFSEGELIEEDESLDTALQHLITGRFQSLLVTRNGEIVGILRLADVYESISRLLSDEFKRTSSIRVNKKEPGR